MIKTLVPGWLIASALLQAHAAGAQDRLYNFEWFTDKARIQGNTVKRVITDHEGMVWLATNKGLCLFTPNHGKHFTHDYQHPASIPSNNLSGVYEDEHGYLWITSYTGGLSCYRRDLPPDRAFSNVADYLDGGDTITIRTLSDAVSDHRGHIWFGGQDTGLLKMGTQERKISRVALVPDSLGPVSIYALHRSAAGDIWVGTRHHGVFRVNPTTGKIASYNLKPHAKPWREENGCGSFAESDGVLWFSYYDHDLCKLDLNTGHLETGLLHLGTNQRPYDNALNAVATWGSKVLAGHTSQGLYSYDTITGERTLVDWSVLTPADPTPDAIMDIDVDSMGTVWIGTKNKGLIRYSDYHNRFATFYPLVPPHPIKHLSVHDGNWWYRTEFGIGVYSPIAHKTIKTYDYQGLWVSNFSKVGQQLFLSTYDQGVWVLDGRGRHPLPIRGGTHGFRRADCGMVIPDTIGGVPYLWIAAWNSGLYKYNCRAQTITLVNAGNGLPDNKLICLAKDAAGTLWVGTDGHGLLRMTDKDAVQFEVFVTKPHTPDALPSNTIRGMAAAPDGSLWVVSEYLGLTHIQPNGDTYTIVNHPNPHASPWQNAKHIQRDALGNLWILTEDGVIYFDCTSEAFLQLSPGMGVVPPAHMPLNAYAAAPDSTVVMATDRGFVVGRAREVLVGRPLPRPTVSSLFVNDQDSSHLLRHGEVRLSYEQNFLTFGFSAPGISEAEGVRFLYMLKGVDKTWRMANAEFTVSYTDIASGNYEFLVRVGDQMQRWSPATAHVPIYIQGPYWQAPWFKTLLVGLFFLLLYGLFRYRLNQSRKINALQLAFNKDLETQLALKTEEVKDQMKLIDEKEKEKLKSDYQKRLSESELKAIRTQMNPHFIFNVLSSIESYVLEQDAKTASYLVQRFAKLSRLVLENSANSYVSFSREWQALQVYADLEAIRFNHSFSYSFQVTGEWDRDRCYISPMLVQPLIENAIHHGVRQRPGGGGKISVVAQHVGDSICFTVTDNGIGIRHRSKNKAPVYKQSSVGIATIVERLKLINLNEGRTVGKLTLTDLADSGQCGTCATLHVPLYPR